MEKLIWEGGLIALLCGLAITALCTKALIPLLRRKAGQNIREDGPEAHLSKAGTPSMGGIAIVLGTVVAAVISAAFSRGAGATSFGAHSWLVMAGILGVFLLFALMGFADDYLKVEHKQNLGLTAKQKLAAQIAVGLLASCFLYFVLPLTGAWQAESILPFASPQKTLSLGLLYIPYATFVIVAMANAVNLTDGLDGLSSSVTAMVAIFFAFACARSGRGAEAAISAALVGALFGFLIYNRHPAKIFMGDTGSLALGGLLAMIGLSANLELFLPIVGIIYVAEAVSVIIQVLYFKKSGGKRFFRMAPLHHHFELGGMSEVKVVRFFCMITCCAVILGYLGFRLAFGL